MIKHAFARVDCSVPSRRPNEGGEEQGDLLMLSPEVDCLQTRYTLFVCPAVGLSAGPSRRGPDYSTVFPVVDSGALGQGDMHILNCGHR